MARFTVDELKRATGGQLCRGVNHFGPVFGVSTDSRKIRPGEVFIALAGSGYDGHNFVAECLSKGAVGAIVSRSVCGVDMADAFLIEVPDTLRALQDIARFHRLRFKIPVIAVTGSNGKTTTKDMIAAVLGRRFQTLKTRANFNNEIGLPQTLLELEPHHEAAVVEMGMRRRGEIRLLAEIALPNFAVITNVSETHIELLGSLENIAGAKAELVEMLDEQGIAILNSDDPLVKRMAEQCRGKRIFYGSQSSADIRAVHIRNDGERGCHVLVGAGFCNFPLQIPVPGRHNVLNALAAAAVGLQLGLSGAEVNAGLSDFVPSALRLEISQTAQGCKLINDVYNASPLSMRAAIDILRDIAPGRAIAVLGDMLELGAVSEQAHRDIGKYVAQAGISALLTFGEQACLMAEAARQCESSLEYIAHFRDVEALVMKLVEFACSGDTILLKGSRGMKMERIGSALG